MSWPTWLYRLSDPRDRWRGEDKQVHLFGAAFAAAEFNVPVAIALILLVELVEAALWMSLTATKRMLIEDGKVPWPFFHDRASLKDVLAGIVGILLHLGAAWIATL